MSVKGLAWAALVGIVALSGCYEGGGGGSDGPPGADSATTSGTGSAETGGEDTDGPQDDGADAACDERGPAAPLRRLTNFEYDNTIEDLLGDTSRPSAAFVRDDAAEGYNTQAAAAAIGQLQSERYFEAAEALADSADLGALVPCDPAQSDPSSCGAEFIDEFAPRGFRRPLEPAERDDLITVFEEGLALYDFDQAIGLVIGAVLVSPSFLYRPEFGEAGMPDDVVALQPFELASRLSYFVWGSMPDFDLFRAAAEGRLETAEDVEDQARRMLDDPRARRAVTEFHAQWLHLHALQLATKDVATYPTWSDDIRAPLEAETRKLIEHLVFEDGDLRSFLTADYTFVDDELAAFYGLDPVGNGFTRVDLDPTRAAGLLTQGSLLAALGKPAQSDPVRRGRFIRERLLCQPLPEPPADVDTTLPEVEEGVTNRERLGQHSQDPSCAACHSLIDPLGFGFEHFDGTGRWRTKDNGLTIDDSGEVIGTPNSDGPFEGVDELGKQLAMAGDFDECFVRQWFRFVFARAETEADECLIGGLRDALAEGDHDVRELLVAFVTSNVFRTRVAYEAVGE